MLRVFQEMKENNFYLSLQAQRNFLRFRTSWLVIKYLYPYIWIRLSSFNALNFDSSCKCFFSDVTHVYFRNIMLYKCEAPIITLTIIIYRQNW